LKKYGPSVGEKYIKGNHTRGAMTRRVGYQQEYLTLKDAIEKAEDGDIIEV